MMETGQPDATLGLKGGHVDDAGSFAGARSTQLLMMVSPRRSAVR